MRGVGRKYLVMEESSKEVTTFSDSDRAGCKDTRKSSSAGVMLLGSHTLKVYTRKQLIIARNSAEAVLFATALGASESKGNVSLLKDLCYEMKPVLATEDIFHRQGIGRLTHVDVAYLWMRDEIRSKRLRVRRVNSEEHVADLGTKPLSKAVIVKHRLALRCVNLAEGSVSCKIQDVAMCGDVFSIHMIATGGRTVSTQSTAGHHVKTSSRAV